MIYASLRPFRDELGLAPLGAVLGFDHPSGARTKLNRAAAAAGILHSVCRITTAASSALFFNRAASIRRLCLPPQPSLSVRDNVSPASPGRELSFRPADALTPAHSPRPLPESDYSQSLTSTRLCF